MTPYDKARHLPIWRGPVDPQPLGGGITNVNFVVEDQGRRAVVRIGDDIPVHQILRFNELAASRAAHAAGVSPAVLYHEPGALVIEFIAGKTLAAADVRAPTPTAAASVRVAGNRLECTAMSTLAHDPIRPAASVSGNSTCSR